MMNSQERLLTIFLRLQAGERLSKARLSTEFGVDPKSIQRDISRLKGTLEEKISFRLRDCIRFFRQYLPFDWQNNL